MRPAPRGAAYSPDGQLVASHSLEGLDTGLRIWRASDRSLVWARPDLRGTDLSSQTFAFSPALSMVAIPGRDMGGSKIRLLRTTDGVEERASSIP